MSIAWIIAGLAVLAAATLGSMVFAHRARIRNLEAQINIQRESYQAKLTHLEHIRDGLLIATDDALLILNSDQKILYANPAAESMLGQSLNGETLIGALRHPELDALMNDAKMLNGDSVERRVKLDRHILRARAIVLDNNSDNLEILTLRDVTELQQLERARREMVSNVTHELSHPITAIGLLADTLLNIGVQEKPKRAKKMLNDIRREADTLTQLVQEMRDLSLIESGQMPIRLMPTPLQPIIEATVEQLQTLADNKDLSIDLTLPKECVVLADDVQIQRALKNILHNAVKFSPEGEHINVSATTTVSEAIIAVRDHGPGIPDEDLERIFERFFQVDRARRDGTGLGLAIVRHIARAHGGRTWAESTEGEGATFYVALTLASSLGDDLNLDDREDE